MNVSASAESRRRWRETRGRRKMYRRERGREGGERREGCKGQ
jgi:hypothetical protein